MKKASFLLLLLLLLLVLNGCRQKVDLGPGYQRFSKRFLQAMRWQDFEGAAGFLEEDNRQQLVANFSEHKDDLHIVDADYRFSRLDKKSGTATSELILEYYLLPSNRVKEWRWRLDWVLVPVDSKQSGSWQVQGEPPTFP